MVQFHPVFQRPALLYGLICQGCKRFRIILILSLIQIRHGMVNIANLHAAGSVPADNGKPAALHIYQNRLSRCGLLTDPNPSIDETYIIGYPLRLIPIILQFKLDIPGLHLICRHPL